MKKNLLRTMFITIMIVASFSLVACGDKEKKADKETTGDVETTTGELESTTEITTTPEVESTTEEAVTEELTTEESTTEEITTEVTTTEPATEETTTEPITAASTQAPTEATTSAPTVSLMDRFHIAKFPADSEVEVVIEGNSIIAIQGPDWRKPADYFDEDCSGPNPYPMYEWTEGRYRCDTDEVTLGYYSYDNDTTNTQYAEESSRLFYEMVNDENYHKITNCQSTLVGIYEGVEIHFNCYFLLNE